MPGKPNDAWMATMIKKMGSREAVIAHQKVIGARGGSHPTVGGFAGDRELARRAGRLGGLKSRRKKKEAQEESRD